VPAFEVFASYIKSASERWRRTLLTLLNFDPNQGETTLIRTKFFSVLRFAALLVVLFATVRHFQAEAAPQRIEITAKRFTFTPGEITIKKGVPVVLVLTSADVSHGLKFKELNVVVNAKKGQTNEVTFTPDKVGTFTGQCSVFCGSGHGSMKLTLHVTE
jgi:cytochrome c oxidase subunit 2